MKRATLCAAAALWVGGAFAAQNGALIAGQLWRGGGTKVCAFSAVASADGVVRGELSRDKWVLIDYETTQGKGTMLCSRRYATSRPVMIAPKEVGVWFIPGLAFTCDGKRLGYGGGWYDRLLAEADPHANKCGIAHSFQIVDDLPSEPHDIFVDAVLDSSLDRPQIGDTGEYVLIRDGVRAGDFGAPQVIVTEVAPERAHLAWHKIASDTRRM